MVTSRGWRNRRSRPNGERCSRTRHRANDLAIESWSQFLFSQILSQPETHAARRANGRPIQESDQRSIYRWLKEGNCPSIWTADTFLIRYGAHLDEYFLFCEQHAVEPWATGHPPYWYQGNDIYEDLEATDPLWRREARVELER